MPRFLDSLGWIVWLWVAALGGGCTPSCDRVCTKLLACDLDSDRVAQTECVDSCERQTGLYVAWEDEEKQEAMDDHLSCLVREDCEDIADGECFDDRIFDVGVVAGTQPLQSDTALP